MPTPFIPQRNGNKAGGRALTGTRRSLRRETLLQDWSHHTAFCLQKGDRCCFALALDFLLTAKRDAAAAKRFLRKTLKAIHNQTPRGITVDKKAALPKAIDELKEKEELSEQVKLR